LPEMKVWCGYRLAGPIGMILVTVSCTIEAIREEKLHDIRGRFGP
jgi:hypothetical protein